jgi:uncharacterized membrane protein YcgQ (UPF0703/DUF1980 family)
MKKIALTLLCLCLLTACQSPPELSEIIRGTSGSQAVNLNSDTTIDKEADLAAASELNRASEVIEIKDKLFVAQSNDIYYNAEDYLGKTITYEGIFDAYEAPGGEFFYSVIRYGPGCCGIDANPGFEVGWSGGYPEPDDWVKVTGILEAYEEDGYKYLRLALTGYEVMPERGQENVTQ